MGETSVHRDAPELQRTESQKLIMSVFQRFDKNSDGSIDVAELSSVLQKLDAGLWDKKRVNRLLGAMDRNHDQKIQYAEFCDWLYGAEPNFQKHRFVAALTSLSPGCAEVFPDGGTVKAERSQRRQTLT